MRVETAATILEYFGGSSWAKPDGKRHDEAAKVLAEFTHEEIAAACKSMRRTISRSHVKPEELVGEIKRNKRREFVQARAEREGINTEEVERERLEMRNAIMLAPAGEVREAVAYCRKVGALDRQPLSPRREEWSAFTIGMVHAALERKATT